MEIKTFELRDNSRKEQEELVLYLSKNKLNKKIIALVNINLLLSFCLLGIYTNYKLVHII